MCGGFVEDVVDFVGDTIEGVVNTVENFVEDPLGTVGNIVEGALDNPLRTAALIAGSIYAPQLLGELIPGAVTTSAAEFVAADAANLAAQGLSAAQIESTLVAAGVDSFIAADAAALASSGLATSAITQNIASSYGSGLAGSVDAATGIAANTSVQTFDDGSQMVVSTETGMPVSGIDTFGNPFTVGPDNIARYATGDVLAGEAVKNFGGEIITRPEGMDYNTSTWLESQGYTIPDQYSLSQQGYNAQDLSSFAQDGITPQQVQAYTSQGFNPDAIRQFSAMDYSPADIQLLQNLGLDQTQIVDVANKAIDPNTLQWYADRGYNPNAVVDAVGRGGNSLNELYAAGPDASFGRTPSITNLTTESSIENLARMNPQDLESGRYTIEGQKIMGSGYGQNTATFRLEDGRLIEINYDTDAVRVKDAPWDPTWEKYEIKTPKLETAPEATVTPVEPSTVVPTGGAAAPTPVEGMITNAGEQAYRTSTGALVDASGNPLSAADFYTPPQTTVPTTTVPPTSDLSQVAPGVSVEAAPPVVEPVAPVAPVVTPVPEPTVTTQPIVEPTPVPEPTVTTQPIVEPTPLPVEPVAPAPAPTPEPIVQTTVPTTTVPPTSDLSTVAPGVSPAVQEAIPVTPTPTPTPVATIPSGTTVTTIYDDGSALTTNTSTGTPVSGIDTSGQTFTVDPTTGTATYDATGAVLGGTPTTNFGGSLANPTDVQNLLDTNAGLPPVVDNSRVLTPEQVDQATGPGTLGDYVDLATTYLPNVITPSLTDAAILGGGVVLADTLLNPSTPNPPKSPYEGQTFTPATPGAQWSGKLVNANMLPSYVGRAASVPFYNTTSPVQSQYYWGVHPYVPLGGDMTQYNNIPEAPATPWGIQKGYFEGPVAPVAPVVYGPNMTPIFK